MRNKIPRAREKTIIRKKHFFSLIELVIVITIIAVASSVIGININKALYDHRSSSNIKKISSYIEFCKKMALIHQADVYMTFNQEEDGLKCEIGTDELQGLFKNQKKTNDFFKDIYFEFDEKNYETLTIGFSSTASIFPKGLIYFYDKNKRFTKQLQF